MSNPAGTRGVSAGILIFFIVVIVACGATAYFIYTETSDLKIKLASAKEALAKAKEGVDEKRAAMDEFYKAVGYKSRQEMDAAFEQSALPVDPRKLESLIEQKFNKRAELLKTIGVEPKGLDLSQVLPASVGDTVKTYLDESQFIEKTIRDARTAGSTPDVLKGTKVGDLIEQVVRLDKAITERNEAVADGENRVADVTRRIEAKKTETAQEFTKMDAQAEKAWKEREVERDKLRTEPPKWAAQREEMEKAEALEKRINAKLNARLEEQADQASPIDGKVVTYDWKTHRGVINLGARDRVKPGYEFEIFSTRPGPDRADKRLLRGRLRVLNVYPDTSLFVRVPSQNDDPNKPVTAENYVVSTIYDDSPRKVFVLKGWFPKGGDYSKETLAGMIFQSGGIVEDEMTLKTDYLVLGEMDEAKVSDPSAEAKAALAEGKKAYEDARHFYNTVLTVPMYFKYMQRGTMRVAR